MSIYAVNGKTPIAAWIPSRDDVGSGTATLTDLVGSNNGTLTNMDPATDWVADTGAGGVRALDFDGVDDFVDLGSPTVSSYPLTISAWVRLASTAGIRQVFAISNTTTGDYLSLRLTGGRLNATSAIAGNASNSFSGNVSTGQWYHAVAVFASASSRVIYVNAVAAAQETTLRSVAGLNSSEIGSIHWTTGHIQFFSGLIDDARIWNVALNATDVADLYAAGNGRGITFGGTIQTRRRRQLGGYGL